jgi:flagellar motor switch protein FliN/FliY
MSSQESAADFLCNEFREALSSVFEQTAGEAYALKRSETTDSTERGETLGYLLEFSGVVKGTVFVEVELGSAAILATKLMGGPADGDIEYLAEHEDAMFEIVSQTAGVMATALRDRFGTAEIDVERKENAEIASAVTILLQAENADPVSVRLLVDPALFDSILASLAAAQAAAQAPATAAPVSPGAAPHELTSENQNLQLIIDVELDLTLRFGQRTLTLSEVADLTTGSVVELDRVVDEPVELLLGERVIARGEVVIVDGNYGMRITELAAIDHNALLSA